MSAVSSPTAPEAKPAKIAASSSPPCPTADTFDRMQCFEARYSTQYLGDRFSSAGNPEHTRAPSPRPPRCFFEDTARTPATVNQAAPTPGHPLRSKNAGSITRVAPDGSLFRSSTGFRAGAVPGNYRNCFDHNLVHRAAANGPRPSTQQYGFVEPFTASTSSAAHSLSHRPVASAAAPVPVHQIRPVVPPAEARILSRHFPALADLL